MPACIVCKGYYKIERSCKEAEQRRKEAEQLRKEAEQLCREAEQRCREVEQRRKGKERRYKEVEQRCKEAEQRRKKKEQPQKGGEQRRKEVEQRCGIASLIKRLLAGIAEQRCKKARQRYLGTRQRYQGAKYCWREAELRRRGAKQRYEAAERRYEETVQHCRKAERNCERCGSDNSAWEEWQASELVEQGGLRGILAFTEPHIHLPFVIIALSISLGLMAAFVLWRDIRPGFRALALLLTPVGCLLSLQAAYAVRMQIRQREMLRQVKRGRRKGVSAQMITLLLPVIAVGAVLILTYALIKVEDLWELVKWLALTRAPDVGDSLPERVLAVLPFVSFVGYVLLAISLTASSSLMLARRYVNRLNEFLPHPIFLQGEKLARIVRREAEVELGRLAPEDTNESWMGYVQLEEQIKCPFPLLPPGAGAPVAAGVPLSQQVEGWWQAATWVWDELERTDDGGIKMKVARQEIYQLPKSTKDSGHQPHSRVSYIVCADPWGCITKIEREEKAKEK